MAKQKKSFLDKITGSSNVNSDSGELKTTIVESEIIEETDEEVSPSKYSEENITVEEDNEKSSDWQQTEYEGQLTIDVYQTDSEIVIKSTIAGVTADDLDVNITNDMVTIKGKREDDTKESGRDYYYQECYWGSFSRSIILPVDIEAENATAEIKDGILTIRLPKAEKVKTKKIKVIGK